VRCEYSLTTARLLAKQELWAVPHTFDFMWVYLLVEAPAGVGEFLGFCKVACR
jgi:hypothetical protein